MKYLVLIGDVVDSRKSEDRGALQRRLQRAIESAGRHTESRMASAPTVTLGDEFQAVYRDADGVFADIFSLLHALAPVRVRFALAIGEIVTPINRRQAIGMDGPAFHAARDVLTRLKKDGRLFGVSGLPPPTAYWLAPTLAVLSSQVLAWRDTRLRLFAGLLKGEDSGTLARTVRITPRAVNKNIRAADLDEWTLLLRGLSIELNQTLQIR
jgi:hypothetical protein